MGLVLGFFSVSVHGGERIVVFSQQSSAGDDLPQLCLQKSEGLLLPPALLEATGMNVSLCCSLQRSDVRVGPLLSPPSCSNSSACGQAK